MRTLTGRVAVLTGAAGGIGAALARALAAEGLALALVDQHAGRLQEVADALPADVRRTTHVADVGDAAAWQALVAEVLAAHGTLHVLIHNAGLTVHGPFESHQPADIQRVVQVDLLGPMLGTAAFLPTLHQADEAHIVLISSMSALFGTPTQATYSAAKAGLRNFGEALRIELSTTHVAVTTVLPGTIATPFLTNSTARHASAGWLGARMLEVGASPDRVARAVVRALRRRPAEVLVGPDACAVSCLTTLVPGLMPALLTCGWRALARRMRGSP